MNTLNIYTTTNLKNSELEQADLKSWKKKELTIDDLRETRKELYRIYCRR